MKGGRSLKVEADRDGGAVLRPRGERGGCAWRAATARRTGSALRAGRVAGSRPDCGPEAGSRLPGPGAGRCWTVAGSRGAWLAACAGGRVRGPPRPVERPPFCAAASSSSGEVGRRLLRLAGCCLPSESVRVGFVPTSSGLMLSTKWFDTPHNSAIARLDRLANSLTANSTHRRLSALLRRWPWM